VNDRAVRWDFVALSGLAVVLLAIAIRMRNLGAIFLSGFPVLFGTDPWYHLRRIELALHGGFGIPQFDSYVNFPTGALIDWPPGFDVLMAAGSLGLAPFMPADYGLVGTLAVLVPILGALTPLLGMAIAWRLYGPRAGFWAGLLLALTNAMVSYSSVGRVDHHVVEPLWLALLLAAYTWSSAAPGGKFRLLVTGAAIGLAPGFWPGCIVFSLPLFLAWLVRGLREPRAWRDGALAFASAAAFAAVLSASSRWAWAGSFDYYALSLFQPAAFLAFSLSLLALWALPLRIAAASLAVFAAIGLALEVPRTALLRALGYLFTTESQISTVFESTPLLEMGPAFVIEWLSPWILVWPLVAFFAFRTADRPGRVCVAWALLLMSGLALLQLRFAPLLAVPFAIVLAGALDDVVARIGRGAAVSAAATVLFLASLWPTVAPSMDPRPVALPHLARSLDALLWLRDVPPATSHYLDPTEQPEYGVLSAWVWGHWVTAIAHKPGVASPLGQSDANLDGVRNSARVLLAKSEREGAEVAEQLGVRFLFLTPLFRGLEGMALQLGHDLSEYKSERADGTPKPEPAYLESLHSQLFLPIDELPASERFRLVYEGQATHPFLERERPYVKIFQLVSGATLAGRCDADEVTAEVTIATNTGRTIPYTQRAAPDSNGAFELRVPYASEAIPAGTSGQGPLRIRCGTLVSELPLSHAAVERGDRIEVTFGTPQG
jgi:asparagine N-glycosylation enzyme membrane subunit Stt3